jgi:hypothetical protein
VDAGDHLAQSMAVGGGQVEGGLAAGGGPAVERRVEGLVREPARRRLVEHREPRVEAGGERPSPQDAGAEPVDRPDPCGLRLPRRLQFTERREPAPNPLPQLSGRLLGEGESKDRPDRHPVVEHGLHEPLDHHGRLSRAGVGGQQRRPGPIRDRGPLIRGEGHPTAARRTMMRHRGFGLLAARRQGAHAASSAAASLARQIAG